MAARRLSLATYRPPALPSQVGIVHLGIGAFHRAHQAVYGPCHPAGRPRHPAGRPADGRGRCPVMGGFRVPSRGIGRAPGLRAG